MNKVYDFIAIGLGPFNLSLACLSDPIEQLDALFLEQRQCFDWHPGLMLDGVTLQTPFMSDLVTLADPTSRFSFLNYAKQQGKLYQFYIRESFFLLREQYNQYCQWAASELPSVRFGHCVRRVEFDNSQDCYQLTVDTPEGEKRFFVAISCSAPVLRRTIHPQCSPMQPMSVMPLNICIVAMPSTKVRVLPWWAQGKVPQKYSMTYYVI